MQVYDFYKQVFHLEDEDLLQQLLKVTQIHQLNKRDIIVREGEMQKEIGFLVSGCICSYTQNSNGAEVVSCFCCKTGDTTMSSFSLNEPAMVTTIALTETELLTVPLEDVAHFVHTNTNCLQLYNQLLQQSLRRFVTMQVVISRGTAMERYRWFLKEYPGLIDTINNKYIASFLQMTNVTLSRLRRFDREHNPEDSAESV